VTDTTRTGRGFTDLQERTQTAHLRRTASEAIAAYPIAVESMRLVKFSWNAIFRVKARDGASYVLRIAVGPDARAADLESEMTWVEELGATTDLIVPAPIRRRDGAFVTPIEVYEGTSAAATLLTWLSGRILRKDLGGEHVAEAGRVTATFHEHASTWTPPKGFTRPICDLDWFHAMHEPIRLGLVQFGIDYNTEVREPMLRIEEALRAYGKDSDVFGLTHADLHAGNLVVTDRGLGVIDFDDSCFCYYLHDLAAMLAVLERLSDDRSLDRACLDGYATVRALPRGFDELFDIFIGFRQVVHLKFGLQATTQQVLRSREEGIRASVAKLKEAVMRSTVRRKL
jgi:Ser/Thr protein kinase RdoA (MazF antagonist)